MLSMKAKYATRAMLALAGANGMMQGKAIAASAGVPVKFLEAILLELKHHGLVGSRRGVSGGYFLARPPAQIQAGDIIRATDGLPAPLYCVGNTNACSEANPCAVCLLLRDMHHAVTGILDHHSLAELAWHRSDYSFLGESI